MDSPVHSSNAQRRAAFHTLWILCIVFSIATFRVAALQTLPAIQPESTQLGRLKRTAAILHQSTPENRGRLKVLFYGQSITLEPWWHAVADWLVQRFPNVDFIIENRAISGFQADKLAFTTFADVHLSQPDLIILHNYGYESEMDVLLSTLRKGSFAEILLQTDHPHLPGQLNENTNPATVNPTEWWAHRNAVTLPQLATRHHCALADVREFWKAYLKQHSLKEQDLIRDVTHPNAEGNDLLAAAIIRYFDAPPLDLQYPPNHNATVQTLYLDPAGIWPSKSIEIEFSGYRIDALLHPKATHTTRLFLDDSRPSTLPGLIAFTRPSDTHNRPWPSFTLVTNNAPLVQERWKLTLTSVSTNGLHYTFRVDGTVTGFDGEGTNTQDFSSRSRRVWISKDAWWIPFAARRSGTNPPVGFQVEWEAKFMGLDELPIRRESTSSSESSVQLASGLIEGPHRLRIVEDSIDSHGVVGLRIYSTRNAAQVRLNSDIYPPPSDGLMLANPISGPKLIWKTSLGARSIQFTDSALPMVSWKHLSGTPRMMGPLWVLPMDANSPQRFFRLANP